MSFYGAKTYGYADLPGQGGGELASRVYEDISVQSAISAAQAAQGNELSKVINHPMGEALRARVLVLEQNIQAVQARIAGIAAAKNPAYPPNVWDADHKAQWDAQFDAATESHNATVAARLATDLAAAYRDYVTGVRAAIADLNKKIASEAAAAQKLAADQAVANELQSLRAEHAATAATSPSTTAGEEGMLSAGGSSSSGLTAGIPKVALIAAAVIIPVGLIAIAMSRRSSAPVAGYRRRRSRR